MKKRYGRICPDCFNVPSCAEMRIGIVAIDQDQAIFAFYSASSDRHGMSHSKRFDRYHSHSGGAPHAVDLKKAVHRLPPQAGKAGMHAVAVM
jgi:hypothetical protein